MKFSAREIMTTTIKRRGIRNRDLTVQLYFPQLSHHHPDGLYSTGFLYLWLPDQFYDIR
jgi:hypothetical protein